ncbi:MAG: hypothetical protein JXQ73_13005 [Phycisphaerae bacterium]|nr:hypothetical protein [Phycisphaerae bacterium]
MNEEGAVDEVEVLRTVKDALARVGPEARGRILKYVSEIYDLDPRREPTRVAGVPRAVLSSQPNTREMTFADRATLSPKEFLHEKQPQTDIERVACLAYYLSHYHNAPYFKTLDISKLNTEAAQLKFSNPAYAVVNATNAGLLASAGKGRKQISAIGERFVDALPDRDAAKSLLRHSRPRRTRKKSPAKGKTVTSK